jgi:putative endonuclease
MNPRRERGRAARRRGRVAEAVAAGLLRLKGFRVLARDLRSVLGEIDIIARRGDLLIFVEVKSRANHAEAAEALSADQRRRIARAASLFLRRRPDLAGLPQRFDAVLVSRCFVPQHIRDAWSDVS